MKQTPDTLMALAYSLAGRTLGELAAQHQVPVPTQTRHAKGWAGQLLETCLGANSGSKPQPDFMEWGIELKTLPIDLENRPLESTFVCTIPLTALAGLTWETSPVRQKLAHVLWIPIETHRTQPLSLRRVGTALLCQPTSEQETVLKQDWEELSDLIALGQLEQVNSRLGTYLQVRPKGANNRALRRAYTQEGDETLVLPRGFYLRTSFTKQILQFSS